MKKIIVSIALGSLAASAFAQAPGSVSLYGGGTSVRSVSAGGTVADVSETVYIGSGTHIIDGTWEIYAKQVVIDPAAMISGTGTIVFLNPSVAGGTASVTLLDANNISNNIDVDVSLQNASGMRLKNIAFPADLVAAGWTNDASSATVYLGKALDLAVDGADVFLAADVRGDLRLDAGATISNYRPERMVVTNNGILSHVVKEDFAGAFVFPVGVSDGDYTPAEITNAGSNTVRVSVQDYTASASPEQTLDPGPAGIPSDGMNRTWHIYSDTATVGAAVNLQHNTVTNQSGFDISNHFVTQWGPDTPNTSGDFTVSLGESPWQTNTGGAGSTGTMLTPAGTLAGSNMRSRNYTSLATSSSAEASYFSKSSDPSHPLPIQLTSFKASVTDCDVQVNWQAGDETGLSQYQLQHGTDGATYKTLTTMIPQGSGRRYQYLHKNAGTGTHFYRLKLTGIDQDASYSSTKTVKMTCDHQSISMISVYPNPASERLVIDGLNAERAYTLRLLAADGRMVLQQSVARSTRSELNLHDLPAALYTLQVQYDGQESQQYIKVIKQ